MLTALLNASRATLSRTTQATLASARTHQPTFASSSRSFAICSVLRDRQPSRTSASTANWGEGFAYRNSRSNFVQQAPAQPVREDPAWLNIFAPMCRLELDESKASENAQAAWTDREKTHVSTLLGPNGPYDGRSVSTAASSMRRDRVPNEFQDYFGPAYARLQRILKLNNVRRELKLAARHEKPGVKRRRLRSERWRKRFAHEVRLKVQLVQEIRARGA